MPDGGRATTVLEDVAEWASRLRLSDIPARVVERARLQQASTMAAGRAGARSSEGSVVREAVMSWAAAGPCSALGANGTRLEPSVAAYVNAAASMAHDWDDYLFLGHTGHSSVWSSWALAQTGGASAYDSLTAQIAANELEGRLGAAVFLGPQNGQLWSWIHAAGAALAAGMVMGLERRRLAHAMAISLSQPPYALFPGFMGPGSKLLTAAEPTALGIRAARLAEGGLTGPLDVLENPRGALAHLAFAARPSMLGALGDVWVTDTLAFKPRPGCAYLQAALDAVLALREQEQLEADDVAGVEVDAGLLTLGMERLSAGDDVTPVRVCFSVALSTAVALIEGRFGPDELDPARLDARALEIRELAARVRLVHDPELTLRTLSGNTRAFPVQAALGDLSASDWLNVRRRLAELGMDETGFGAGELVRMLTRPEVRQGLAGRLLRRDDDAPAEQTTGIAALDTARLRLTFPARVRMHLRNGRVLEAEGEERGACGAPLEEQGDVVAAKWVATGGNPERLRELTGLSPAEPAAVPA